MLTVRITLPKNLDQGLHAHIYTFVCPACGKYIAQLNTELTATNCKWCKKPIPNIKGIIEREVCRAAWYGTKPSSWEKYE